MSTDGKHVLMIDDDPDMHDVARLVLEPLGYRVTCYATGSAGMEALRKDRPDVLLLDIMLATPREGLVLANEIKHDDELKTIPIIMISAIGQAVGEEYARELDDDHVPVERFMEKPLDPLALREAVTQVLQEGA